MTGPQSFGCKTRKPFASWLGQSTSGGVVKPKADDAVVRLIDSPHRLPATSIEQRLASLLRRESEPVFFGILVKRIAEDIYEEELRMGAAVLDIGMFGSRLFHGDVVRELKAGDGILWEIKHGREISCGLS